jgi:hypothetical protein
VLSKSIQSENLGMHHYFFYGFLFNCMNKYIHTELSSVYYSPLWSTERLGWPLWHCFPGVQQRHCLMIRSGARSFTGDHATAGSEYGLSPCGFCRLVALQRKISLTAGWRQRDDAEARREAGGGSPRIGTADACGGARRRGGHGSEMDPALSAEEACGARHNSIEGHD